MKPFLKIIKVLIVLFFSIVSMGDDLSDVFDETELMMLTKNRAECVDEKNSDSCVHYAARLAPRYKAYLNDGNHLHKIFDVYDMFDIAWRGCRLAGEKSDLDYLDACGILLDVSELVSRDHVEKSLKFIENKCQKNAKFCFSLMHYYEQQKDYAKALSFGKRHYDLEKNNFYPYLVYKRKDKQEGLDLLKKHCFEDEKNDFNSCALYMSWVPEHPDIKLLAETLEKACRKPNSKVGNGQTNCDTVGNYYYKGNPKNTKAFEFWILACQAGYQSPCLKVMAAPEASVEEKKSALISFCPAKEGPRIVQFGLIEKSHCPLSDKNKIPDDFIEAGKDVLKNVN